MKHPGDFTVAVPTGDREIEVKFKSKIRPSKFPMAGTENKLGKKRVRKCDLAV